MTAGVVVGDAGVPDWVTGAELAPDSKRLFLDCPPMIVNTTEVIIKTAAAPEVNRVKKLAPPELPNTV